MKKFLIKALMLMSGCVSLAFSASAQMEQLPKDPAVRYGTLPNGLTYYIRHNETPKGQADFYIAQKVGSILEEDEQRGLAHFLEHMCFNGTKNFEGNEVVKWLETKGVKFGMNLNAYTSIDETVYNISNVPVTNEAVQDSCLLILHDWADGLLLLPEEIDKERGVIHEEWRMRNVGQQRLMEKLLPDMYPGSKYGYRLPIGTMEVVDNFPYQALRDYYEAWYRPDQQGVVVVGDIDVDAIEKKIKDIFSPIEMPEDAEDRDYEPVPDTEGTIYVVGADPEMPNTRVQIYFKNDVIPFPMRNTIAYLAQKYVTDIATSMLNARLDEIGSTPDSPFAAAGSYYGNYFIASTKDALTVVGIAKDGKVDDTLASIYRELLRAIRGGFTFSEYDRARSEYLSQLEKEYNNRAKTENEAYVNSYVRNFIDGTPMMDIEKQYPMMQMLANQVPVEAINEAVKQLVGDNNRVVSVMMPEKEGLAVPTKDELANVMKGVDAEEIAPFVDDVKAEPLIPQLPAPGKIVSEKKLDKWGAIEWVLSNGAKVVVKPTEFKADEILFDAQALGGTSVFPDEYAASLMFLPYAQQQHGLGEYSYKDLQKYLQGKQCSVSFSFDDYMRDVAGTTTPKDLPVMMELIYMGFTNYTISPDEFAASQNSIAGFLHNQETEPQYVFGKEVAKALYSNPRKQALSTEAIQNAKLDQTLDVFKKMTANAADYIFFFVGSINLDTFRPLVEQYIATLPADTKAAVTKPEFLPSLEMNVSEKLTVAKTPMQTPQTYALIIEPANIPYTMKDRAAASIAGQILSQRLLEKVREEMGAVYSIGAYGQMERVADKFNTTMLSQFPMKPELQKEVLDYVAKAFKEMETTVKPEELAKVTEFMIKNVKEQREKNQAWLNGMAGEALNGVDTFNGAEEMYASFTVDDIQNFMKKLNGQGNYRVILLEAEESPAK